MEAAKTRANTEVPIDSNGHAPQRYMFRKALEAVKTQVAIVDVADWLCGPGGLRRIGERWVGKCPLPDHDDRTPSFVVYPEDAHFHCFGCGAHGDVLDLHQLANGFLEKWEALIDLANDRGVELPQRPPTWFARQDEKARIRQFNERIRRERRLRRWFRIFHRDDLAAIPDLEERRIETERTWSELQRWMPHERWTS